MENNLSRAIGNGVGFPIKLSPVLDQDGKPTKVYTAEGGIVESIAWVVDNGDPALIIQNITQIFETMVGSAIRREDFGSHIYEMLEEPNNQLLSYSASKYITEALNEWEPRVKLKTITLARAPSKLTIRLGLSIGDNTYHVDLTYNL